MSPGSSSTGSRLIVAPAAAVSMLVAPGPIEEVQAKVCKPVLGLGEGRRGVDHGLLVAGLVVAKVGILVQRLPDAGHVAVAEDAKAARRKRAAPRHRAPELIFEEVNQRLGHGQADGGVCRHGNTSRSCGAC